MTNTPSGISWVKAFVLYVVTDANQKDILCYIWHVTYVHRASPYSFDLLCLETFSIKTQKGQMSESCKGSLPADKLKNGKRAKSPFVPSSSHVVNTTGQYPCCTWLRQRTCHTSGWTQKLLQANGLCLIPWLYWQHKSIKWEYKVISRTNILIINKILLIRIWVLSAANVSDLQYVVQRDVSEALAGDAECAGGFLHLMRLVPGRLSVLHLCYFHILAQPVKVLLGLLKLPNIPDAHRGAKFKSETSHRITVLIQCFGLQ